MISLSFHLFSLENTDVIAYPLFLVLCDTLGNPSDIADFLAKYKRTQSQQNNKERGLWGEGYFYTCSLSLTQA
jgi:hypothetical protein